MMTPKLTIAAFFVLATFNISFVVCIHRDNYTRIPIGNYYKFYDTKSYTSWTYAKERCESDGGMLYYPNNEQELEAVFRALDVQSRMPLEEMHTNLHIGYSEPNYDGLLKTVDGRSLTFVLNKWAPEEPKISCFSKFLKRGACSCTQMKTVASHEMSIIHCNEPRPFICNHRPDTNRAVNAETGELEPLCPKDYIYIQIEENYYKYYEGFTSNITWYGAKAKCESDGAELFHPDNLSELEQVFSGLRNTSLGTRRFIFLGFSNLDKLEEYKTMDGRLLHDKYQEWGFYNPVPKESSRCGALFVLKRYLNVVSCYSYEDFICKIRGRPLELTDAEKQTACGDYDYIPSLKSCYKYHKDKVHWNTSRAICQSEGGDLFYPYDEQELNLVLPKLGFPDDEVLHAGFSDLEKHGVFQTVNGRPLEQVFARWEGGALSPLDQCSGLCNCGRLFVRDRSVFTGFCNSLLPFVCKRAAASILTP